MKKEIIRGTNQMHELSVIYTRPIFSEMPTIKSSMDANAVIREAIGKICLDYQEYFWCLYLNNANKVLGFCEISTGDATGTIVNIPKIFAIALKVSAKGLIIVHNHPSGTTKPSKADISISEKIKFLANLHSMELLDSLIITTESYVSFNDENLFLQPTDTLPF